jgi:methyl-accepting chemotaxis protein
MELVRVAARLPHHRRQIMADMLKDINTAIASHELWKTRLLNAIETGSSEWVPRTVKADNQCDFGKWLYTCPADEEPLPHYNVIKQLHAQFHMEAGRILEIALLGNKDNAIAELEGKYTQLSSSLIAELLKWKASLEKDYPRE